MAFSANLIEPVQQVRNLARLRRFVTHIAQVIDSARDESELLARGRLLLSELVAQDDWLPETYAQPSPERYQQYLLHCDSRERFSVVSFVWGPGQSTPIHDHRVWGLVGVLRGAELNEAFVRDDAGVLAPRGPVERLEPGQVVAVSPQIGDVHRVYNAFGDRASISIHVYGGNIGAVERATYDASGRPKPFVSGYSNRSVPNLWDRA